MAIATPPKRVAPASGIQHEPPAAAARSEPLTEAVLSCHDLRKRFGDRTAVDGVGFEIRAGETYGLLGPNGAGKTTTISMVCGILAADAGDVLVAGTRSTPGPWPPRARSGTCPRTSPSTRT